MRDREQAFKIKQFTIFNLFIHSELQIFAGFEDCNFGSSATCNCAIRIKNGNSMFYWDACGIWTGSIEPRFFYVDTTGVPSVIDCGSQNVSSINEINNTWWDTPANAVDAGGNFLCVESEVASGTYFVSTILVHF